MAKKAVESPVLRLQQLLSCIGEHKPLSPSDARLSIIHGPREPELVHITLGKLLALQSSKCTNLECLVVPWTSSRWTYRELKEEADRVAKGMIAMGIAKGDRVGILAGNCEQYVSIFFATAQIGAILVLLNATYTPTELSHALDHTGVRLLFIPPHIGRLSQEEHLDKLLPRPRSNGILKALEVIILRGAYRRLRTYSDIVRKGTNIGIADLISREEETGPQDVCVLHFTSGTTGKPKVAMLTHHNLINNSRFVGDRMNLRSTDILCCPPPLFHCFGLVLGLLAVVTHGSKIVYPSEIFDPGAVIRAVHDERCTALHGVPTMFESILNLSILRNYDVSTLRTGIIAGAPVSRPLMERLLTELNMSQFTSSYGLTEASPTCFNAFTTDSIHTRLTTVGKILPHANAKVVDDHGYITPVGQRGELCISGYQVFQGYWNNPEKTAEVLATDQYGVTWLKTGDEAFFDAQERCIITGRLKDIIIRGMVRFHPFLLFSGPFLSEPYISSHMYSRPNIATAADSGRIGGENIYPLEIEERLVAHPAITAASVIGVPDGHYGEVVGAFVQLARRDIRPTDHEMRAWVREKLGRHKEPLYVFVLGENGLSNLFPTTGSGKIIKPQLREIAVESLKERRYNE